MANASREGADAFYALSRRLKAAGQGELRKELSKTLQAAAKPLIAETRKAAARDLPQRGGLAKRMSKSPQTVQVRTGAKTAGVRIALKAQPGIITGKIRHPIFWRPPLKRRWVEQQVNGEWWDDTLTDHAPDVVPEINKAIVAMHRRITEG